MNKRLSFSLLLSASCTLYVALSGFSLVHSAEAGKVRNLTEVDSYRVNLTDPGDTLSCRSGPDTAQDKITEYPNGSIIRAQNVVVTDNKPWFETHDGCYVRAHAAYLTPFEEKPQQVKPVEKKAPPKAELALDSAKPTNNTEKSTINLYNPLMVALAQLTPFEGLSQQITLNYDQAESPNKSVIIITEKGYLDDSVSGARYTFQMVKNSHGHWSIFARTHLLKCHEGRGHQEYSEEPCL